MDQPCPVQKPWPESPSLWKCPKTVRDIPGVDCGQQRIAHLRLLNSEVLDTWNLFAYCDHAHFDACRPFFALIPWRTQCRSQAKSRLLDPEKLKATRSHSPQRERRIRVASQGCEPWHRCARGNRASSVQVRIVRKATRWKRMSLPVPESTFWKHMPRTIGMNSLEPLATRRQTLDRRQPESGAGPTAWWRISPCEKRQVLSCKVHA